MKFDIDDLHGRRSGIEALLRAMTQRAEQAKEWNKKAHEKARRHEEVLKQVEAQARYETALKCGEIANGREAKLYGPATAILAYAATLQPSSSAGKESK